MNDDTFVLELKKKYLESEDITSAINQANEAQDDLFRLFSDFAEKYEETKDDSLFDEYTNNIKDHVKKYKSVSEFSNTESKIINDNLNKLNDIADKSEDVEELIYVLEDLGNTLESYSKLLNLSIKTVKEVGGMENE